VYCALVKTLGRRLSGNSGQGKNSKAEENDGPLQGYKRRGSSRLQVTEERQSRAQHRDVEGLGG
ncbi:hypothetical protein PV328_011973, partial [Microctonus aethiopoides]